MTDTAIRLLEFEDAQGASPFGRWFERMEPAVQTRVTAVLIRARQGNLQAAKSVGTGVSEFRIDSGPGYRIYFGRDGDRLIVLLGGGTKKRQQADILLAQRFWQDYKRSKAERTKR